MSFFRTIARSLGTAHSDRRKAIEVRSRIDDALRGGGITVVIDEAEYCFRQTDRPTAPPERINWLMTALSNYGVPVALIDSQNFSRLLSTYDRRCGVWGAEQFTGRIRLRKELPDQLSRDDLFAVATLLLPAADRATRSLLVGHALNAKGFVAALENTARRADYFAGRAGRTVQFSDVEAAMKESGDAPFAIPGAAQPPDDSRIAAPVSRPHSGRPAGPSRARRTTLRPLPT